MCRIQGKAYELLLSPGGIARTEKERAWIAEGLVREMVGVIRESGFDAMVCVKITTLGIKLSS